MDYFVKDDGSSEVVFKKHSVEPRRVMGGAECIFIPVKETTDGPASFGYKCFLTSQECIASAKRQKKASLHKIAPDVLSNTMRPIELFIESQRVKVALGTIAAIDGWGNKAARRFNKGGLVKLWAYKTQVAKTVRKNTEFGPEYSRLSAKMRKHGFPVGDLADANMGRIDGKLVCIDFGNLSS